MSTLVTHGLGQDVGNGGGGGEPEPPPLSLNMGFSAECAGTRIVLGTANFNPTLFFGSTGEPLSGISGSYNFTASQCSAVNVAFKVVDGEGVQFDTFGATAVFTIRKRKSSINYLVQLSSAPDSDFRFLDNGDLYLHIPSTTTAGLSGDNYYCLDIENADTSSTRLITGQFYVHDSVTGLVFV